MGAAIRKAIAMSASVAQDDIRGDLAFFVPKQSGIS
jgi:hypothetical protein